MKRLLLFVFLLLSVTFACKAQTYAAGSNLNSTRQIYQKFNEVIYGNNQTPSFLQFSVYVTKEIIDDPLYEFKYDIVVINHSLYNNEPSRIYMSGIRTFVNGVTISGAYPNGFWSLVPYEEATTIFFYKTNDTNLNFSLTWENIQHY